MCCKHCRGWMTRVLTSKEVEGKKVIEIGSRNINGSVRGRIMRLKPSDYIGIDIVEGDAVDIICDVADMLAKFGKDSFDLVVSTYTLEHIENWRKAISNIKNVCKANGVILITTVSYGWRLHSFPNDFWRFEIEDFEAIFSDCEIMVLERGIYLKAKKLKDFKENDLSGISLYSMKSEKRIQ